MRSQKLDALRGGIILGMIFFHLNYILIHLFGNGVLNFSELFYFILGRGVAWLFIFLSGVSFCLSVPRKSLKKIFSSSLRRCLTLSVIALMITFVTYMYFPQERIYFGILHFFALASILMLIVLPLRGYSIPIGIFIIILGEWIRWIHMDSIFLIPLGIVPQGFYSADYYPIIPWFGYMLIGYGMTYLFRERKWFTDLLSGHTDILTPLAFMGRHSLLIYVVHVPVLYFMLKFFL